MTDPILGPAIAAFFLYGGVVLAAGVLPVTLFLIIEGLVALLRGRGVAALLIAVAMVALIGGGGYFAWQSGLGMLEGTPAYESSATAAQAMAITIVGWALLLGAFGFVMRMLKPQSSRRARPPLNGTSVQNRNGLRRR